MNSTTISTYCEFWLGYLPDRAGYGQEAGNKAAVELAGPAASACPENLRTLKPFVYQARSCLVFRVIKACQLAQPQ
jgi:hypothetical protein